MHRTGALLYGELERVAPPAGHEGACRHGGDVRTANWQRSSDHGTPGNGTRQWMLDILIASTSLPTLDSEILRCGRAAL